MRPLLHRCVLLATLTAQLLPLPTFHSAAAREPSTPETSTEPSNLSRTWQGIPGIERTPKGRIFISWFSGGRQEPAEENTVFLTFSDDGAKSLAPLRPMAGPRAGSRSYDPTLWIDPEGRLWYIFNRSNRETAAHGVYARICEQPDAESPAWGPEFRVGFDEAPFSFRMNKPTVLSNGDWIMPVTHSNSPIRDWFAGSRQLQGAAISKDKGKTWTLKGALKAPEWALENMIVELKDRRLWMLIRTGGGVLWQSHSTDGGFTWNEATPSDIPNPGSRFFIRRLASGNLLLINHYKFTGRSHLTARLSTDDGASWNEGLLVDGRGGVSYPDAIQDKDGLIWMIQDRDRQGDGEILLSTFREEDVASGAATAKHVMLRKSIDRLGFSKGSNEPLKLLPADWDAKAAAERVLARLFCVTAPEVKGAHDAEMAFDKSRAYVVAEVNDIQAGESADWPHIYSTLSVVDLNTLKLEKTLPIAKSGQVFENHTLEPGACFVPRILKIDAKNLRCYFASESPRNREAQTWYTDFNLESGSFENRIHRAKLKTSAGIFDMQPRYLHEDAARQGFTKPPKDFGLYIFDSFKTFKGKTYVALNNYPGAQNALAELNKSNDTFEVIGHFNDPSDLNLTESAINKLPDGRWIAICRQESGNRNYTFTTSTDGKTWTSGFHTDFVPSGSASKPTFDRFNNVYYLGWQDRTTINGVSRSVFNIDVSSDCIRWERKYRFETEKSFQYPTFRAHNGSIWLCVTQGDSDKSRKERIMFGRLE